MANQLPTDTAKMPGKLSARVARGGKANFTYLGTISKATRLKGVAWGIEQIGRDNYRIWAREKGSWSSRGNAASITQAKRNIASRSGVEK